MHPALALASWVRGHLARFFIFFIFFMRARGPRTQGIPRSPGDSPYLLGVGAVEGFASWVRGHLARFFSPGTPGSSLAKEEAALERGDPREELITLAP
ncbi:MAG: hypothetical protein EXR99_12315 [Gemmataceae bacterium]|nr:hypothetical protein [Gemmataceae bacterium]